MKQAHLITALILLFCLPVTAKPPPAVLQPIEDEPGLPRVLLIGDSISMGYTLPVRKELEGIANVHRPPTNGGPTTRGLEQLDAWLGDTSWDVIHFNWGLHDLKYMGPKGKGLFDPQAEGAHQQVPLEQYEKNLDHLVQRMKKTGATLIWAATTPVPKGSHGRIPGDEVRYNQAALRVMKKHGVQVNDLHAFALPGTDQYQRLANVHYTGEGSAWLGRQVAEVIRKALPKQAHP